MLEEITADLGREEVSSKWSSVVEELKCEFLDYIISVWISFHDFNMWNFSTRGDDYNSYRNYR